MTRAGPHAVTAPRFQLRASVEAVPAADGDVYLVRAGSEPDQVVRRPDDVDRALLRLLAREALDVSELRDRLAAERLYPSPDTVEAKLAALVRAGVALIDDGRSPPLPGELEERFARQLPWFAEHGDPREAQRRLREATVVVIGCGGLGTWTLAALASAGVGRFVLVDDDTVELSNLNRQILYRRDDVGKAKVERAAAWISAFDGEIVVEAVAEKVSAPADVDRWLDGAAAVVQAADSPPYEIERWVNEACGNAGVPFITAGQVPPVLKIGPTYVPGESACFECHQRWLRRRFPLYDDIVAARRRDGPAATTLGPASGVVGTLLGMEIMHVIVGLPIATRGRALILDMATLETRWEAIDRDPSCPACRHLGG